jgi:RimJ/RimL family protein N-acetyltransferase
MSQSGDAAPAVRLREAERADAQLLLAWLADAEVARWLLAPEYWRGVGEAYPEPPPDEPAPHVVYAVDVPGEGCVGIGIMVEAHGFGPDPELGIVIGRRDLWGRGIGSAAVRLMLAAAAERGWRTVRLATLTENARAIRCYERCGFRIVSRESSPWPSEAIPGVETTSIVHMRIDLSKPGARPSA